MHGNADSGSTRSKNILYLNVVALLLLHIGGGIIPASRQAGDITVTLEITETTPPTETLTSEVTETLTASPSPEPPTGTESPSQEATVTQSLVSDQSLGGEFVPGEVIIRFRRTISRESINDCVRVLNAAIKSEIEELYTLVLSVPEGKVAQTIAATGSCNGIRFAEPNYLVHTTDVIPDDSGWANQYGLINIRAPQGWEITTGSSSITIAIADTGIDLAHIDIAGKIVGGYDFVNNDSNPQDDNGHGTHVAGIAAAISNNGTGVAGVSWGARLMPIKVLNSAGNGTYADVSEGIVWASDHGAQIINLSLGGNNPSQVLQDAVDYASSQGVVLVAASGNSGSNFVLYPARYPAVIAVAATDSANARAGFSNYGPEVDLAAPGVSIYSTTLGGYTTRNGTSMAAPYVAGLAAILRGIPGNSSPSAIAQQMQSTAMDLGGPGWDDFYGYGLIQMDTAIAPISITPTPTEPQATNLPNLPGGLVFALPLTLTSTETPLPTPTEIASPSQTSTIAPAPDLVSTNTPEVIALDAPEPETADQNWLLPFCGLSLILLGILLFWAATHRKRFY